MGKFLKGLAIGAALGAGAAVLRTTKGGKQVSKKAAVVAEDIWKEIKEQYEKLPPSKTRKIDAYLRRLVRTYAAKKKLALGAMDDVVALIKKKLT